MSEQPAKHTSGWRAQKGPVESNTSGFRALGHRILLSAPEKVRKTEGGILLLEKTADAEFNNSVIAQVIEIGCDAWMDKAADYCEVGDYVLVGQYTGKFQESDVDGKIYRFVQDLDILSTVQPPKDSDE